MAPQLEARLVPGIREFLARRGATPTAVASNAEPENIDFLLDLGRFRESFDAVVNGHEVTHPKPHPEAYILAAERIRRRPQDCIVFEDSAAGVGAARAVGAKVAGIETTLRPVPDTDISVRDFRDPKLYRWLQQIKF
jgi:HAD superfamily hydrolase (TIGR01509 family)